ncbi:MAG TPA: hydantoinase B/oxoprolinase family protein, partial [Steroidobacteraceae bacterium]|nr:hydantoinase B/oxoprolinase family protein [Steroidobacteraceae bacterium]
STDVSLFDGEIPQRFEHRIAGVRLQRAMLDVHTIAAGGGSVLRFEDGRLAAGPQSAGADPGPACYGRGGPLTLTDAQVALGRLRPDTLPRRFGAGGASAIDREAVLRGFDALARRVAAQTQRDTTPEALAVSYLDVAVESMANAIRHVAMRQGQDAGDFALFCFGGAAGQYACRVAEAAGMTRILVHPLASVLSAFGIGIAPRLASRRASLRVALDAAALGAAAKLLDELERQAREELAAVERDAAAVQIERRLELRAGESETSLSVPEGTLVEVTAAFAVAHERRFGIGIEGLTCVVETVRVEARASPVDAGALRLPAEGSAPRWPSTVRAWFDGWRDVPLVASAALDREIAGPALIVEPHSTVVLEDSWRARRLAGGELLLERTARERCAHAQAVPDAARIEIFDNLFMHVAEQMGEVLRQTAQSVNIKERLDYSCALFDGAGGLVANAPHMPVHLGSMGASVRAVMAAHRGRMRPGDAWLINSPYHGGTHLPDMTVVTPVFFGSADEPQFYVASRAHHADIGGTSPGSMPAFSRTIDEEGTLFEDFQLVSAGSFRETALRQALASAAWPARKPDQNVADLRGQLAANARGIAELERAVHRHGLETLRNYMGRVQANAAECVRAAIAHLTPGRFRVEMDGGQLIDVRIDIHRAARRARIDFTGTSPQGPHNFNAPRAVCTAAVLYVFRTLVERPIPLNEGCIEPLEIVIPPGSMLDPAPPAAVAAGNVETSQCIVDALYGALGVLAASQGTMNNLTFG